MRSFVLSLATLLAFAGTGFAQTNTGASTAPKVKKTAATATATTKTATTATTKKKTGAPAKSANVQKAAAQQKKAPPASQQKMRAARYGGFAPAPAAAALLLPVGVLWQSYAARDRAVHAVCYFCAALALTCAGITLF